MRIITNYIRKKFLFIFSFLLITIIMMFLVIDLVENLDKFIDKDVSYIIIAKYYMYYIPYIIILVLPMVTLMATVFSISSMAKNNEITALKALGISMSTAMKTLLIMGVAICIASFFIAENVAISANRKMFLIKDTYLEKKQHSKTGMIRNIRIQEPPDKIVTIGIFDKSHDVARDVTVETFNGSRLVARMDAPYMEWNGTAWVVTKGMQRLFQKEEEFLTEIDKPLEFNFRFTPKQIELSQLKPDEMKFSELIEFIKRIRESGGETYHWLTDLHVRVSFPFSNIVIIFFSIPLVYNRRQKSFAAGFGISLIVSFIYFGLVKTGQTMGHKGTADPFIAAWIGNIVMIVSGIVFILKTRK